MGGGVNANWIHFQAFTLIKKPSIGQNPVKILGTNCPKIHSTCTFTLIYFRGMRDGKGANEIVFSGTAKKIAGINAMSFEILLIVQKKFNKASSVAVLVNIR